MNDMHKVAHQQPASAEFLGLKVTSVTAEWVTGELRERFRLSCGPRAYQTTVWSSWKAGAGSVASAGYPRTNV